MLTFDIKYFLTHESLFIMILYLKMFDVICYQCYKIVLRIISVCSTVRASARSSVCRVMLGFTLAYFS